ncbi:hypothetical protein [Pseudodesulfovibrio piezophilus]|uniref:Uncharacterized protein n=1 Tax=Pseudodesulfovibrio piezophilus (strain DSM 21447 / JCM 15486 / C1TLV30) TaxID=1322246 RepID=M1WXB8_PSEP2|nr:hypothetical protein [Pseudodesulfovibrio piezophilus]CCH49643.1 conserved protein of unknown function [Pseudodesulfovibrio piezophilus C1TLV30]
MSISTPSLTNFTAGEMSPRLEGRTDLSKYYNGCRKLKNFHIHPHGGITRRSGFRFVAQAISQNKPTLLIPFEFNGAQTYVLEFGEEDSGQGRMRVFADHGVVLSDGEEYLRDIPYKAEELEDLRFAQTADILILIHPSHPVRKMTRLDHDDWALEELEFMGQPEVWGPENYPSAVCFFEQRLVLAATPNEPGTLWFSRTGEMTDFRLKTREVPLDGWRDREILDSNSDGVRNGQSGDTFTLLDGDGFENKDGIKGQDCDGITRYYRYKGTKSFVASGDNETITFKDSTAANTIEPIWTSDGVLNEQYWDSFEVGERTDAQAGDSPLSDDGIEVTLSGRQANAIEFMVPRSRLWIGTAGGEWTVSGASSEALSPENVKANHEGTCGAARSRPESVGFATLFIQRSGRKIREMAYRFESDAYVSKDLSLLSEHITETGVTQLAFVQEPDAVLYCVRNDGLLAALTYDPSQDVAAWSRHETDGVVEGVTSIYSDISKRDELWVVVRREVQGEVRRYIEYLEKGFSGVIEEAFFVDSGLSYSGESITELTGLDHLAGRTVTVLADGSVQTDKVVSDTGAITLDRPSSTVHAGLPYVSSVQPMRLEGGSQRGTTQTKRQRITKVSVRFHETLGGKIGPSANKLESLNFRSSAIPMDQSVGAFSGDKSITFPKGWTREGLLTVTQEQPLPMTILLIVPTSITNE